MEKLQPPAGVFIDQRERRRMHARRDAKPAREALHQLRLARAELAGQSDDQSMLCLAAKLLAKRFGFRRAM